MNIITASIFSFFSLFQYSINLPCSPNTKTPSSLKYSAHKWYSLSLCQSQFLLHHNDKQNTLIRSVEANNSKYVEQYLRVFNISKIIDIMHPCFKNKNSEILQILLNDSSVQEKLKNKKTLSCLRGLLIFFNWAEGMKMFFERNYKLLLPIQATRQNFYCDAQRAFYDMARNKGIEVLKLLMEKKMFPGPDAISDACYAFIDNRWIEGIKSFQNYILYSHTHFHHLIWVTIHNHDLDLLTFLIQEKMIEHYNNQVYKNYPCQLIDECIEEQWIEGLALYLQHEKKHNYQLSFSDAENINIARNLEMLQLLFKNNIFLLDLAHCIHFFEWPEAWELCFQYHNVNTITYWHTFDKKHFIPLLQQGLSLTNQIQFATKHFGNQDKIVRMLIKRGLNLNKIHPSNLFRLVHDLSEKTLMQALKYNLPKKYQRKLLETLITDKPFLVKKLIMLSEQRKYLLTYNAYLLGKKSAKPLPSLQRLCFNNINNRTAGPFISTSASLAQVKTTIEAEGMEKHFPLQSAIDRWNSSFSQRYKYPESFVFNSEEQERLIFYHNEQRRKTALRNINQKYIQ